jgi:hypothetical protein
MTSEMNFLLEKLQEAIDEAIADSGRINAIVAEMKRAGYELSLVLESSIAISPIEVTQLADSVDDSQFTSTGEIALTGEDLEFLQELNISF